MAKDNPKTTTTEAPKETAAKKAEQPLNSYYLPEYGKVVKAASQEEAIKKVKENTK